MDIPETITIDKEKITKKRPGARTTEEKRRAGTARKGKLGHVPGKRHHYTEKEKMNAACTFAVVGNSFRCSELTGIPVGTIRSWKCTEWWQEVISRIQQENDEELDVKLSGMVNKAVEEINDRLVNGDYIYNAKNDKLVRKPISAKELAVVTAIAVDKRQLLRGQPTSRVEKVSQDERLKKLGEQFKAFSKARTIESEGDDYALEEGVIEESDQQQYSNGDEVWEAPETSRSDSNEESWEEQEEEIE